MISSVVGEAGKESPAGTAAEQRQGFEAGLAVCVGWVPAWRLDHDCATPSMQLRPVALGARKPRWVGGAARGFQAKAGYTGERARASM